MNPLTWLYHEVLFRPLFNLLVGITNVLPNHSVGLAIIFVTIIVRLILLPSSLHQARQLQANQTKMAGLQRELKAVADRHKNDKAKRAEATMRLYKQAGINPASGCLPLLIQLPILLALYRVFFIGMGADTWHNLYTFVSPPTVLSLVFAGVDLLKPSLVLGIVAGVGQFAQMRWFAPTPPATPGTETESAQLMVSMQRNMMYIFPVMTVFIALQLPAALALYWVVSTLLALGQQYLVRRTLHLTVTPPAV